MFEKKKVWWISCSTGCTCCADQNFDQGFYDNDEEPTAIIEKWSKGEGNPLASQYAKYGRYHLECGWAEILPDGRWIVEGTVFLPDEVEYPGRIYW
jgi:hypothetical protein